MPANISNIMFELESAGISKERVVEIVTELLRVGRLNLIASLGEMAGKSRVSDEDLQAIAAFLVAWPKGLTNDQNGLQSTSLTTQREVRDNGS